MTEQELEYWRSDFEAYQSRFAHHFSQAEPREQATKYVRGLLAPVKLAVSATCPAGVERPAVVEPSAQTGGRPRAKSRLVADAPSPTTVAEVVAGWSPQRWKRLTVALGENGPRLYEWGFMRVVESRRGQSGSAVWLLARRSVPDPQDLAYYLSNAPPHLRLLQLAQVASSRYTLEQCFEEAKGETGLDEYAVRTWHSWHRQITLSMMAYAWLSSIRAQAHEKGGTRIEPLLS